jgi:porphobilinogen synthase
MVRETTFSASDLIYPVFATHEEGIQREISSMPGCYHFGLDRIVEVAQQAQEAGISALILFGIPESKDAVGSGAYSDDGVVQEAVRRIKSEVSDILVVTDVCLCEYTSHGHCGILKDETVDNDPTLELLAKTAVSHAQAGADIVAPSDMMDGRVEAIRSALDDADFEEIPILSYAAKYASAFYGPFRDAADSAPSTGDRQGYQMDPCNLREAMREIQLDVQEGADMIMIKPGLAYLDVLHEARLRFDVPLAAYNVSGEYAMVKAAAANGWIDEKRIVLELLTAFKRAGADMILTYHALDAARWLQEG